MISRRRIWADKKVFARPNRRRRLTFLELISGSRGVTLTLPKSRGQTPCPVRTSTNGKGLALDFRQSWARQLPRGLSKPESPRFASTVEDISSTAGLKVWQTLPVKAALISNEDYGYDSGYVPTFVRYAPGDANKASCIVDAPVYLNDAVSFVNGEYIVSKSYYTIERKDLLEFFGNSTSIEKIIEGKVIPESDVSKINDSMFIWKREKAALFHDPIIKAFLDAYVSIK